MWFDLDAANCARLYRRPVAVSAEIEDVHLGGLRRAWVLEKPFSFFKELACPLTPHRLTYRNSKQAQFKMETVSKAVGV
jgi:hypothetical protein